MTQNGITPQMRHNVILVGFAGFFLIAVGYLIQFLSPFQGIRQLGYLSIIIMSCGAVWVLVWFIVIVLPVMRQHKDIGEIIRYYETFPEEEPPKKTARKRGISTKKEAAIFLILVLSLVIWGLVGPILYSFFGYEISGYLNFSVLVILFIFGLFWVWIGMPGESRLYLITIFIFFILLLLGSTWSLQLTNLREFGINLTLFMLLYGSVVRYIHRLSRKAINLMKRMRKYK